MLCLGTIIVVVTSFSDEVSSVKLEVGRLHDEISSFASTFITPWLSRLSL